MSASGSSLAVEVLSPSKIVLQASAYHVRLPGANGYIGILPGHTPLISELSIGTLTLEDEAKKGQDFFISGGFVQVEGNRVKVLVDIVERASDIDLERAKRAERRARERLEKKASDLDLARAQAALARALARQSFASSHKH